MHKIKMFNKKDDRDRKKSIQRLLDARNSPCLFKNIVTLQNNITISSKTNIVAITSIGEDDLSATFAYLYAKTYLSNNNSTLLIDANLYNPRLKSILDEQIGTNDFLSGYYKTNDVETTVFSGGYGIDIVFMKKEPYPSEIYRNKTIHQLVKDYQPKYTHIVIIVPSLNKCKELLLISDVIDTSLVVVKKNKTKKEEIFDTIRLFAQNNIPMAKIVII